MNITKSDILNNICYTPLVYGRINKKLKIRYLNIEIETMVFQLIKETNALHFERIGKNMYVSNQEHKIRITINSNTYRIITVDKISL